MFVSLLALAATVHNQQFQGGEIFTFAWLTALHGDGGTSSCAATKAKVHASRAVTGALQKRLAYRYPSQATGRKLHLPYKIFWFRYHLSQW